MKKKKKKHLFPFLSILTQSQLDRTRRAYVMGPDFKIVDILFPTPRFSPNPFPFFFFSCYCCSGICFVFGWSLTVSFSINRSALFYIQVLLFYSPFNVKGPMVGCAADGRTAATLNALQFSVLCRCWHLYRYCPLEEIVKKQLTHTHSRNS
jgi:hypothetical protein